MNLEDTVRAAVHDLADEAPVPHDLAAAARIRGRRLRRRRRTGFGALALAMAALVGTPYVLLRGQETVEQAAATPWDSPYRLPGGVIVTALGTRNVTERTAYDGNVLLDRRTGRYAVLPAGYYTIWGAPVGGRAAVADGRGNTGVVDAGGGGGVWQGIAMDPVWSSDGTRLLFTTDRGFGVMEAATGDVRWRTAPMERCPDVCMFTWLPGDREVAVARRDEKRPDAVKDVAIYAAATGRLVRVVPVPGVPVRQDAWSPDGRLVLALDRLPGEPVDVVEVGSGRTVATIAGRQVHFLPDGRILSLTDRTAGLYDATGRLLARQPLQDALRDRELSIGRP